MGKSDSFDHQIHLEEYPSGTPCSATRCADPPLFHVSFRTKSSLVERRYCAHHGYLFAHKHDLKLPPNPLAILEADLGCLSLEQLKELHKKVSKQLFLREEIESHAFKFDSIGPAEPRMRPFVARLKLEGDGIGRFFFGLKSQHYGSDRLRVTGTYKTFTGAVIEKRMGPEQEGQNQTWARYIVDADGQEVFLGLRHDEELEARVIDYLRHNLTAEDLAASRKQQGETTTPTGCAPSSF